jgi:hypothetical protein
MERSEDKDLTEWAKGWSAALTDLDMKSRYDRYVCAALSGNTVRHPDLRMDAEEIANKAMDAMLAADKRWEQYTNGDTP